MLHIFYQKKKKKSKWQIWKTGKVPIYIKPRKEY